MVVAMVVPSRVFERMSLEPSVTAEVAVRRFLVQIFDFVLWDNGNRKMLELDLFILDV